MSHQRSYQDRNDSICRTCAWLNYTEYDFLKPQMKVKTPFQMSRLHTDLLKDIVEKMDTNSFARFRCSNKEISEYIDSNRAHMKLALFHTMKISICALNPIFGPLVHFRRTERYQNAHTVKFYSEKYQKPYNTWKYFFKEAIKVSYDFNTSKKRRYDGMGIFEVAVTKNMLEISLREWHNDPFLRRELTGVFLNNYVVLVNPIRYNIKQLDFDAIAGFFERTLISKTNFMLGNVTEYAPAFQEIKPVDVKLVDSETFDSKFLKMKEFENVKHLSVSGAPFRVRAEDVKKIETLVVLDNSTSKFSVNALIQKWISGDIMLKKFFFAINWDNCSLSPNMYTIKERDDSWKYCKELMSVDEWNSSGLLWVYELLQPKTEKKAICIISESFARFKVKQ